MGNSCVSRDQVDPELIEIAKRKNVALGIMSLVDLDWSQIDTDAKFKDAIDTVWDTFDW